MQANKTRPSTGAKKSVQRSVLAAKRHEALNKKKAIIASANRALSGNKYGQEIKDTVRYFLRNVTKKDFSTREALLSALRSFENSENRRSIISGLYLGGLMYQGGFLDKKVAKARQSVVIAKIVPELYRTARAYIR